MAFDGSDRFEIKADVDGEDLIMCRMLIDYTKPDKSKERFWGLSIRGGRLSTNTPLFLKNLFDFIKKLRVNR